MHSPTTLFKAAHDVERRPLENCHEGKGPLDWSNVIAKPELPEQSRLRFLHQNILHPSDSIGLHGHEVDEEYDYFLSGTGTMTLDDQEQAVGPGDLTAVFPGGKHALENTGREDLHFIVFSIQL